MTSETKYLGEPCGGTSRIKQSATESRKRSFDLGPADHMPARAGNKSGAMRADIDKGLAELVWKYFGEEISETLREVQEVLAPEKGR